MNRQPTSHSVRRERLSEDQNDQVWSVQRVRTERVTVLEVDSYQSTVSGK